MFTNQLHVKAAEIIYQSITRIVLKTLKYTTGSRGMLWDQPQLVFQVKLDTAQYDAQHTY